VGQGLLIIEASRSHFRHTTLGRTPLDKWSARRRDLYLTTHNNHKRQTSMPLAGFEPAIPASKRPQTHALDCAATGISEYSTYVYIRVFVRYHVACVMHDFRLTPRCKLVQLDCFTLEDGIDNFPETSVTNCHSTLHNIADERKSRITLTTFTDSLTNTRNVRSHKNNYIYIYIYIYIYVYTLIWSSYIQACRSRLPCRLSSRSAIAWLLGSLVRNPLRACIFVSCIFCVLCR
jgi:hypothetical protein